MPRKQSDMALRLNAALCILMLTFCAVTGAIAGEPAEDLVNGFENPPVTARTRGYWWWLRGNTNKETITRDLNELKAKGYGGAMITDAGKPAGSIPDGPVFASPEWLELFRHALDEADRLGLKLGLNMQSGWNLGGPDVKPEESMKKVTWSETRATGPGQFERTLPVPDHRGGYYRDVAVLAYPLQTSPEGEREAEITASSSQPDYPPALAIDGDPNTFWVSAGIDPTHPVSEDAPEHLQVTFQEPFTATGLKVKPRPDYGPRSCRLQARKAEGEFRTVKSFDMKDGQQKTIRFDEVEATVYRLVIRDAYDPNHPDSPRNVQVKEITFLGPEEKWPHAQARPIKLWQEKAIYKLYGTFSAPRTAGLLASHPSEPNEADLRQNDLRNLTDRMDEDGNLDWHIPEGNWVVLRIGHTLTGAHTKTHGPGWRGLSVDHLEEDALRSYWSRVVEKLLDAAGPHVGDTLVWLHTDSWEMGAVNWTGDFIEDFERRRGYDPTSYLPVLTGKIVDSRQVSNRFLYDFRRTVGDCIAEDHYGTFAELAEEEGLKIHPESGGPHAAPIDALKNLGRSHMPMGEFWARAKTHRVKPRQRLFMKQAASAAHIYGKKRVSAESFTTIGPHWERDPWMLKPTFDREACEGMNLLYWHTFTSSPQEMGVPGQEYFAGTHMNPNVTWWDDAGAFISYMNRCHYMLQQGHFVADAVYYYGDLVPNFVRHKETDPAGVLPGYDYDVTNTEVIMERMRAKDGRIVLPNGISYRVLVLPDRKSMRLRVLQKIEHMVKRGLTVVGPKPEHTPGLRNYPEGDERLQKIADRLWDTDSDGATTYGEGRVIPGRSGREVLQEMNVQPDFTYQASSPEAKLDYIHRRTEDADLYYVVNRKNRWTRADCRFRVSDSRPELWNPATGEQKSCPAYRSKADSTIVPLRLAPYGSTFVVFRGESEDNRVVSVQHEDEELFPVGNRKANSRRVAGLERGDGDLVRLTAWESGNYDLTSAGGTRKHAKVTDVPSPRKISGPWKVTFQPKRGAPDSATFDSLISWTESKQDGIRYFSGSATYHKTFSVPQELAADGVRVWLDLGKVKNLAEVTINGQNFGVLWKKPFRAEITDALQSGTNRLEVTVTNLWPNRLIGDGKLPKDERHTKTCVRKFYKGDHELLTSGLLGPVRLLPAVTRGVKLD